MRPDSAPLRAGGSDDGSLFIRFLTWVTGNKTLATVICCLVMIGFVVVDAALWSGKVIHWACSYVGENRRPFGPCLPTARPSTVSSKPDEPKVRAEQTHSDPRRELKDGMGIDWSEENFWKAVARGDERATALFLRDGMTISSQQLHAVLSDRVGVKRAALHQLVEMGRTRNAEFCSSDDDAGPSSKPLAAHRTVLRFADYAKDEQVSQFVQKFCGSSAIVDALNRHLAVESNRVTSVEQVNARNQKSQSECLARFLTDPAFVRYRDVIRGAASRGCRRDEIKDELERSLCLHPFPFVQQTNAYGNVLGREFHYEPGVRDFCAKKFPVRAVDRSKRDELASAIALFRPADSTTEPTVKPPYVAKSTPSRPGFVADGWTAAGVYSDGVWSSRLLSFAATIKPEDLPGLVVTPMQLPGNNLRADPPRFAGDRGKEIGELDVGVQLEIGAVHTVPSTTTGISVWVAVRKILR